MKILFCKENKPERDSVRLNSLKDDALGLLSYIIWENIGKVDSEIRKFVEQGYERARKVLKEKIDDLHKLAKALLVYETLTGSEIEDLINKNIYPTSKEDLKVEDDKENSALGSIGLKPKIVH